MSLLPSFSAWRLQSTWNIKFQVCVHTLILIQTRLATISRVKQKVFPRCIYCQANSFLAHTFIIYHTPTTKIFAHLGRRVGGDGADQLEGDVVFVVSEGVPASHQGRVWANTRIRMHTPEMGWERERGESRFYSESVKHQGVDGIHFPEEKLKTFKVSIMCVCRNPQLSRRFVLSHE